MAGPLPEIPMSQVTGKVEAPLEANDVNDGNIMGSLKPNDNNDCNTNGSLEAHDVDDGNAMGTIKRIDKFQSGHEHLEECMPPNEDNSNVTCESAMEGSALKLMFSSEKKNLNTIVNSRPRGYLLDCDISNGPVLDNVLTSVKDTGDVFHYTSVDCSEGMLKPGSCVDNGIGSMNTLSKDPWQCLSHPSSDFEGPFMLDEDLEIEHSATMKDHPSSTRRYFLAFTGYKIFLSKYSNFL